MVSEHHPDPPEQEPDVSSEAAERSARVKRTVKAVASVLLGWALLVGVLPRLADVSQVWDSVRSMTALEVGGLALFSAWNIITYQFVMMSALPGLKLRHAFMTGQISTAVANTVPAGALVGVGVTYSVLASFGHGGAAIALASVLTGWWNTLVKLGLPVVALGLLSIAEREVNTAMLSAAIVGIAILLAAIGILVLVTTSDRLARALGTTAGKAVSTIRGWFGAGPVGDWAAGFAGFRRQSAGLLRRRWHVLTVSTIVSHVSLFWVLLAALRHLGVEPEAVSWQEALAAFAFVRLATALPITPGGLGIVEVGMSAALVLAGGDEPPVVAAVLVYRALTYLLQVLLGVISYAFWRAEMRKGGQPLEASAPGAEEVPPPGDTPS